MIRLTCCVSKTITQAGFDLSGIDFLMLGTLYKNITFGLVPTLDPDGTMGIETAFVRFDNVGSSWVNIKMGKFELDNLLSEKRIETLSNNGSFYSQYHFVPIGDSNPFGMGDNQLGIELMGHDASSWMRYTVAFVSDADGTPGLPPGTGQGLDGVFTLSKGWQSKSLGPQRVGLFGVLGQYPTLSQTSGGEVIGGTGSMNKSFYRIGATAQLWFGNFEFLPQFMHASDNVYLGLGLAGTDAVPSGAKNAEWNGALLEVHYIPNSQFIIIGRYEQVHMTQQSDPDNASNYGNTDQYVIGLRSYPFMFSRDGLAFHVEYSLSRTVGGVPLSGDGVGAPPLNPTAIVNSSSVLLALDFAF